MPGDPRRGTHQEAPEMRRLPRRRRTDEHRRSRRTDGRTEPGQDVARRESNRTRKASLGDVDTRDFRTVIRPRGPSAAEIIETFKSDRPPPDDATVRRWIDEYRMEKYG